ncbi:MAG TPA: MBL fold metallo-hydrolase [Stenomitos sp.]
MLEDEAGDILRKARLGQSMDRATVARQAGLSGEDLEAYELLVRPVPPETARVLAGVLGLDPDRLARIAAGAYAPKPQDETTPDAIVRCLVVSQENGWTSNCYLFGFKDTEEAVIVDPGAEPERILAELEAMKWRPRYAAITHGHRDHVGALETLLDEWALSVLASPADLELIGLEPERIHFVFDGERFPLGRHCLQALTTPGHTLGGVSYLADHGCFVGDALFAGSIGYPNVQDGGYRMLRESLAAKILTLPPETRLYPGHGPSTTVAEEREANPFFSTSFIQSLNVP